MVELETSIASQAMVLNVLERERALLEERVSMMRPASLSADLAEEQIRFILGYQNDDEIVVISD